MKLKDLIKWAASTKDSNIFEYHIVSSKFGQLNESEDYRLDMPIISLSLDRDNKEIVLEVLNDK